LHARPLLSMLDWAGLILTLWGKSCESIDIRGHRISFGAIFVLVQFYRETDFVTVTVCFPPVSMAILLLSLHDVLPRLYLHTLSTLSWRVS